MTTFVSKAITSTVSKIEQPPVKISPIDSLPDELILHILARANREDVYHFALAGRTTAGFLKTSYLWRLLFLRDFPQRLPTVFPHSSWEELYRVPVVTRTNIRNNRAQITALPSHAARITSLSYSGPLLLTGDQNGVVKVRAKDERGNFQEVQTIQPCKDGVFQVSPQQDYLLFQAENTLKIYKRSGEFKKIQSLDVDGSEIMRFRMDGDNLTISTIQNSVIYTKDQDGLFQESVQLEGCHLTLVSGDYLFAAMDDERVQILKKNAKGQYQSLMNYLNGSPSSARPSWIFFENGHLILATFNGKIKIWKEEKNGSFTGPKVLDVQDDFMNSVNCFEVKGDYIFVGMQKGQLTILKKDSAGEFKEQPNSETHRDRINALIHYENYLISGSTDGTVKIWEKGKTGVYALLQTLSDPDLKISVTNLSMEDNKLVIAYFSGAVKIWDFFPKS
jgi:WD40 repeat protein